jgi:hypothetical protein
MRWAARVIAVSALLPVGTAVPANAASPLSLTSGFYVNPSSAPA